MWPERSSKHWRLRFLRRPDSAVNVRYQQPSQRGTERGRGNHCLAQYSRIMHMFDNLKLKLKRDDYTAAFRVELVAELQAEH